ncbi:ABC transporter permease [Saccharibacillus sacchari]|uniref:ABC transporter permease n=1 Tax=Saccharibacillus sacchari TaxID=456493 RepID=UPI000A064D38|nr:ABC transporter permease [Saccharibacillus sacchari]
MSRPGNEAMKENAATRIGTSVMKKATTGANPSANFSAPAGVRQGNGPTLSGMIRRTAEVELYKILAQFKYRAVPVLVAIVPLVMLLLNGNAGSLIRFSPENLPYTLLSLAASVILPLVACMLAADLFAGERERGELKIPLTRPVSRPALAIGKVSAMLVYQAGLLAILLILSLTAALLSGASLGDLNLFTILGAYIVTLLPIAAISTVAAFASTLARSATSGFLLGIVLLVALNGLALAFPAISPMFLTEYAALYKSIIGSEIAFGQLAMGAGILIGSATILSTAQILLFDRKEV